MRINSIEIKARRLLQDYKELKKNKKITYRYACFKNNFNTLFDIAKCKCDPARGKCPDADKINSTDHFLLINAPHAQWTSRGILQVRIH